MGDHDDDPSVLFPNHSPEAGKRPLNRTLSCNIGPRLSESVDKVGVQVFLFVAVVEGVHVSAACHPRTKPDPGVVV